MESVRRWLETSPFTAALGVECVLLSEAAVRLRVPFREDNANPGKALHGGVAASLAAVGGQAAARLALGPGSGPWHSCGFQVNYLAAAIGEDVIAEAKLLRRGKELCFVEVEVATADGKPIAHATSAVRGRFGAEPAELARAAGDDGLVDPGAMGPHIDRLPFMARCGIRVERMQGGRSRLVMPFRDANRDASGEVHEGAVLALLDTSGAMAAWAETGPGRFKASTPALQAQVLAPPPKQDLVAWGRVAQRDRELFWSDVAVAGAADQRVYARGTVIYRIVTGAQ
jgi:uncharacterized protein (TIGR00369 family)